MTMMPSGTPGSPMQCAPCTSDLALVRQAVTQVSGTLACAAHAVLLTHPNDNPGRRRARLAQLRQLAESKAATASPAEQPGLELLIHEYTLAGAMDMSGQPRPDGSRPEGRRRDGRPQGQGSPGQGSPGQGQPGEGGGEPRTGKRRGRGRGRTPGELPVHATDDGSHGRPEGAGEPTGVSPAASGDGGAVRISPDAPNGPQDVAGSAATAPAPAAPAVEPAQTEPAQPEPARAEPARADADPSSPASVVPAPAPAPAPSPGPGPGDAAPAGPASSGPASSSAPAPQDAPARPAPEASVSSSAKEVPARNTDATATAVDASDASAPRSSESTSAAAAPVTDAPAPSPAAVRED